MNSQVDMDAENVAAEIWLADFLEEFNVSWGKGLEQAQPEPEPQQELNLGAAENQEMLQALGGLENAERE